MTDKTKCSVFLHDTIKQDEGKLQQLIQEHGKEHGLLEFKKYMKSLEKTTQERNAKQARVDAKNLDDLNGRISDLSSGFLKPHEFITDKIHALNDEVSIKTDNDFKDFIHAIKQDEKAFEVYKKMNSSDKDTRLPIESDFMRTVHGIKNSDNSLISKDPGVQYIAKQYIETLSNVRESVKKQGFDIKDNADYVIKQIHNKEKIKNMGFDSWSKIAEKNFDLEKMKGDRVISNEALIKEAYENITSDFSIDNEGVANSIYNVDIRGNNKKRSVFFKDSQSDIDYRINVNGSIDALNTIKSTIATITKTGAINKEFGASPALGVQFLVKKLNQLFNANLTTESDVNGSSLKSSGDNSSNKIINAYNRMLEIGEEGSKYTSIQQMVLNVKNFIAKTAMHKAGISALGEPIATNAGGMMSNTLVEKIISSVPKSFSNLATVIKATASLAVDMKIPDKQKHVLNGIGFSFDHIALIKQRESGLGGFFSLNDSYADTSRMAGIDAMYKNQQLEAFSYSLGSLSEKSFSDLQNYNKMTMKFFKDVGIGEKEWNVLRLCTEDVNHISDGNKAKIMHFDKVSNLSQDLIKQSFGDEYSALFNKVLESRDQARSSDNQISVKRYNAELQKMIFEQRLHLQSKFERLAIKFMNHDLNLPTSKSRSETLPGWSGVLQSVMRDAKTYMFNAFKNAGIEINEHGDIHKIWNDFEKDIFTQHNLKNSLKLATGAVKGSAHYAAPRLLPMLMYNSIAVLLSDISNNRISEEIDMQDILRRAFWRGALGGMASDVLHNIVELQGKNSKSAKRNKVNSSLVNLFFGPAGSALSGLISDPMDVGTDIGSKYATNLLSSYMREQNAVLQMIGNSAVMLGTSVMRDKIRQEIDPTGEQKRRRFLKKNNQSMLYNPSL